MRIAPLVLIMSIRALAIVEYGIVPATPGDRLHLEVAKTGLFRGKAHRFEFPQYRGGIRFDKEDPARSSVDLEIDTRAFVLKDDWVSEKDRQKIADFTHQEMLDTVHHPSIRYRSTRVEPAGGQIRVTGDLTIRGQTRPVEVLVRLKETAGGTMVFEGSARFRMTSFGLNPPSAALGAIGTRDEMDLSFVLTTRPR